ncbi:HVA22-like protein j [Striga hermonthica]|uniref:HVA22-like protein n=1 Tax=Striga hermonthica TaxID=68872 RepID=A0A9N7RNH8_STRHE|nr:HVA22-like protein j [Striga hermonthica]
MIGELITSCLLLVLGYAYPAFQCFKTVEKNRVEITELRFWCQYWLPMYGEMKLALFIYLWYPKTKGTGVIYDTLLRPYVSKHETDIDRRGERVASPPRRSFGFFRRSKPEKRAYRNQTSKSEAIKVELQNQRHFIRPEDVLVSDPKLGADKSDVDHEIEAARNRLRRFIDG